MRFQAVIFDLDGTLVDSFAPLADAVNAARAAFGMPPRPVEQVRRSVGRGLAALLAAEVGPDRVNAAGAIFHAHYARFAVSGTRPLAGVPEVPRALAAAGLRLAIASNKPPEHARPIVAALGLEQACPVVLGPGPGLPPKPHPAMLREACARLGVPPGDAIYVGDMPLDVESAANAGIACLLVPTGVATAAELAAVPGARVAAGLPQAAEIILHGGA